MNNTSHDHGQLGWARDWLTSEHDIVDVPVASLRPGDSPRLHSESKADAQLIAAAVDVPPIIVHQATMTVIDGWRRVTAAQHRDQDAIAARFFLGTLQEGYVLAVAANTAHGLSLCTKDRKTAATRLLGMHPDCSDRMIAELAGLSHHTVAGIRRKCSGGQFAHLNKRLGRDGKTYPPRSSKAGNLAAANLAAGTVHNARAQLQPSVEPMVPTSRGAVLGFHLARAKEILRLLWNDPTVRSHDKGKTMLDLVSHSLRITIDTQAAIRSAPEYCRNAMAEYAAACGDSWHRLAKDLRSKIQAG